MAYDDSMATYSTGDLATATEVNKVTSNVDFLHSRPITLTVPGMSSASMTLQGDWVAESVGNQGAGTAEGVFMLAVPDNFDTLVSAQIKIFAATSFTADFDINTDFNTPGANENYNQHSGSLLDQTLALTANKTYWINISSTLTGLVGGDVLAVRIGNTSGVASGSWFAPLLKFVYAASDTVP